MGVRPDGQILAASYEALGDHSDPLPGLLANGTSGRVYGGGQVGLDGGNDTACLVLRPRRWTRNRG